MGADVPQNRTRHKPMGDLDDILAEGCDLGDLDLDALDIPRETPGRKPRGDGLVVEEKTPPAGQVTGIGLRVRTTTKTEKRRFYDLKQIPHAVELLRPLPEPNETVHAIMGGDFACWDLVPAILELVDRPALEVVIATLGFNAKNNHHLGTMLDQGRIGRALVLCSDYFAKSDADTFRDAKARLEGLGSTLAVCRNHAKVIAIDFGHVAYVVEGSANMRSCKNLEQITIANSRPLFEFHRTWIRQASGLPPC